MSVFKFVVLLSLHWGLKGIINSPGWGSPVGKSVTRILGILNNTFQTTLVQKFSRIKIYNALALLIFYMEAKSGPLEKRIKYNGINREDFFSEQPGTSL
jgi:hypothetical protein